MTHLFYIPIEPLEERYTAQWYKYFPIEFQNSGYAVTTIDGKTLTDFVDTGTFLPMNSTVHYKNTQMQVVAKLFQDKKVNDGDIFFIADLEFWGIEAIRLMSQMNGVNIKIYAFLHAASYTKEDAFQVAAPYQKYTELGWVMMCDGVFVGSKYHKESFLQRRGHIASIDDFGELDQKIHVTGNPVFNDEFRNYGSHKNNQIIISNRFDWEKRPNMSLNFAYILKKRHPDWRIVVTTSRPNFKSNKQWLVDYARGLEDDGIIDILDGLTKQEYYQVLSESKVMLTNSIEENFGYCIAEAIAYNTYPLAQNALSHPELVHNDADLLFDDEDEIIPKIEDLMVETKDIKHYLDRYHNSINNMITIIKGTQNESTI